MEEHRRKDICVTYTHWPFKVKEAKRGRVTQTLKTLHTNDFVACVARKPDFRQCHQTMSAIQGHWAYSEAGRGP